MKLRPGFIVSLYKHYAGSWQPESRVRLNSGTVQRDGAFFPRDDWCPPSDAELRMLTDADSGVNVRQGIEVFTIPDHLHKAFWELDLDGIANPENDGSESSTYNKFIEQLADFLRFIDAPLAERCSFQTIITAQGLSSTSYDGVKKRYLGLQLPRRAQLSDSDCMAAINFGEESRFVVWLNLWPEKMLELLQTCGGGLKGPATRPDEATVTEFMSAVPDYPVVRIRFEPGEGYLAPLHQLVQDGYTRAVSDLDFNLIVGPATPGDYQ